ncbi:MAG: hypothetical protein P9L92_12050 [Candidatus Electryonea clarkiae]|nr:hypothetical protein [Candidatus Electryonea clarkiae]
MNNGLSAGVAQPGEAQNIGSQRTYNRIGQSLMPEQIYKDFLLRRLKGLFP